VTVGPQVAEGKWVVTRVTGRGTHLGTWLGMMPSGEPGEITGVNIDRVGAAASWNTAAFASFWGRY
jgi:hypothetical protein